MPYILPSDREILEPLLEPLVRYIEEHHGLGPGHLNYLFTKLALAYVGRSSRESYVTYNEIVGALECAKLELYRRRIAHYEESKIQENGDVQ